MPMATIHLHYIAGLFLSASDHAYGPVAPAPVRRLPDDHPDVLVRVSLSLSLITYIYIYLSLYVYIYIYICTHIIYCIT